MAPRPKVWLPTAGVVLVEYGRSEQEGMNPEGML